MTVATATEPTATKLPIVVITSQRALPVTWATTTMPPPTRPPTIATVRHPRLRACPTTPMITARPAPTWSLIKSEAHQIYLSALPRARTVAQSPIRRRAKAEPTTEDNRSYIAPRA